MKYKMRTKEEREKRIEIEKLFSYIGEYAVFSSMANRYKMPGQFLKHAIEHLNLKHIKDITAEDLLKYLRIEDFKEWGTLDKDVHEPTYIKKDKQNFNEKLIKKKRKN